MFIVNQDGNKIINADHVVCIYIKDKARIMGETSGGVNLILGTYIKRDVNEVFKEMINSLFIPNIVAINTDVSDAGLEKLKDPSSWPWGISVEEGGDIRPYKREVYCMPEE